MALERESRLIEELRKTVLRREDQIVRLQDSGLPINVPEGVRRLHIVVEDSEIAMLSHGSSKVTLTDQDANELTLGVWHDMPSAPDVARARHLVIPVSQAPRAVEDVLVLRRFQLYPVEVVNLDDVETWAGPVMSRDRCEEALERLEERGQIQPAVAGRDRPHWSLSSELRQEAIDNLEALLGGARDGRGDRSTVTEARLIDERNRERQRAEVAERERDRALAERPRVGTLEVRGSLVERVIARGRQFFAGGDASDAYEPPTIYDVDLGEIRLPPTGGMAVYRGEQTPDGMRFELIDLPAMTGEARDVVAQTIGVELDLSKQRELDDLRLSLGKSEEARVAAEERRDELQAYVDEIRPHMRALVDHLAGEEAAWWVTAAKSLGELDRLERSVLAYPHDERPIPGSFAEEVEKMGEDIDAAVEQALAPPKPPAPVRRHRPEPKG